MALGDSFAMPYDSLISDLARLRAALECHRGLRMAVLATLAFMRN